MKTAVLIHGLHVDSFNWEHLIWGDPLNGLLGRASFGILEALRRNGARGIGQSSWGPTGFAFAPTQEIAGRLYDSSIGLARAEGLEIVIAEGRNSGASVEKLASA